MGIIAWRGALLLMELVEKLNLRPRHTRPALIKLLH